MVVVRNNESKSKKNKKQKLKSKKSSNESQTTHFNATNKKRKRGINQLHNTKEPTTNQKSKKRRFRNNNAKANVKATNRSKHSTDESRRKPTNNQSSSSQRNDDDPPSTTSNSATSNITTAKTPIDDVLKSILDPTYYPFLYFPEYLSKRQHAVVMDLMESSATPTTSTRQQQRQHSETDNDENDVQREGTGIGPVPDLLSSLDLIPVQLVQEYQHYLATSKNNISKHRNNNTNNMDGIEDFDAEGTTTSSTKQKQNRHDKNQKEQMKKLKKIQMVYKLMARTVIVPYSHRLIQMISAPIANTTSSILNITHQNTNINTSSRDTDSNTNKRSSSSSLLTISEEEGDSSKNTMTLSKDKNSRTSQNRATSALRVVNHYKNNTKTMSTAERKEMIKRKIKLAFGQSQSQANLVDNAISSLVQRREIMRRKIRLGVAPTLKSRARSTSSSLSSSSSSSSREEYEIMCEARNILAEGYALGSFGSGGNKSSSSRGKGRGNTNYSSFSASNPAPPKNTAVHQCSTMAPGIQCTNPNFIATFTRTSPLIRMMHNILGDDLMRELLLDSIILVPAGTMTLLSSPNDKSDNDDEIVFEEQSVNTEEGTISRGNYFQICGPPLTGLKSSLAGKGGKMMEAAQNSHSCHDKQHQTTSGKKRKRGRSDDDSTVAPNEDNRITNNITDKGSLPSNEQTKHQSSKVSTDTSENYDPHWVVPRHHLFYAESYTQSVGLPPSHILNRLTDESNQVNVTDNENSSSGRKLLDDILHLNPRQRGEHRKRKRRKRWKRLQSEGSTMCVQILKGHKKCDYARLLERHCPLPESFSQSEDHQLSDLVHLSCTPKQVKSFLSSVLTRVFPPTFWGSDHNLQMCLTILETFLTLRRMEQYPLKAIVHGIRVLDLKWLFNCTDKTGRRGKLLKSDHEAGTRLMYNQMRWLYCNFIIPLLRSTFYITETEFTAKAVHYFRKPVWARLRNLAIDDLMKNQYREMKMEEASKKLPFQRMGLSRLRILPKQTGIRPISVLCRRQNIRLGGDNSLSNQPKQNNNFSTNTILRQPFDILKFEHQQAPRLYGAGVTGFEEVHCRIRDFTKKIEEECNAHKSLYFASVDIYHCYDNIDQAYLLKIIRGILGKDEYLIQKHSVMYPFDSEGKSRNKGIKNVGVPGDALNFEEVATKLASRHSESVIVDGINCQIVSKESVMSLLKEHLSSHSVVAKRKFGPQILVQKTGIAQGSVISTMLCNFYYGNIEKELLNGVFLNESDSDDIHLLIRVVDDFLLVTTDKNTCTRFVTRMLNGKPELGVQTNKQKTRVSYNMKVKSFDDNHQESCFNNSCILQGGKEYFSWCGMLLDTKTCGVKVDYTRFEGTKANDSLTIDRIKNEGTNFDKRIKTFVRPRCQAIFFDPFINADDDIKQNFHQAIAFAAIKAVAYMKDCMRNDINKNSGFIVKCIEGMITFAYNLISKNLSKINEHREKRLWIQQEDAMWLGIHAFKSVLSTYDKEGFKAVNNKLGYGGYEARKDDLRSVSKKAIALLKFALSGG